MYRGALVLLLLSIATDEFLETTIEKLAVIFIKDCMKHGAGKNELVENIEKMPLSESMKAKLLLEVYEKFDT